jgi:hypothetical protein
MRRVGAAALVALALMVAPAANAKTFNVDWREQKVTAGRAVFFRVTRIVITPTSWSLTLSIRNGTRAALRVTTPPLFTTPIPTLSIARKEQYRGETALVDDDHRVAHDPPPSQLPRSIAKGATWSGTIGGTGKMRHGRYVVGLGWFDPLDPAAGGRGFYWITDHSVRY